MNDNYTSLANILDQAMNQASSGKGQERHASGEAFTEQPMFWIEREFKSFQLGQAVKKIHEAQRLEPEAAKREILGAIVYLAAHCIMLDELIAETSVNEALDAMLEGRQVLS
jgi:hypothetical protein